MYILPYAHTAIFSYSHIYIYSHIYVSAGLEGMQGFPCRCDLTSSTEGPATEGEVRGREGEGGREGGREGGKEGRRERVGGRERKGGKGGTK